VIFWKEEDGGKDEKERTATKNREWRKRVGGERKDTRQGKKRGKIGRAKQGGTK